MSESPPHLTASLAALQQLIMGSTLVKCAATDLGIQWAGWALASAFKTEKFYDLAGKVTGTRTHQDPSGPTRTLPTPRTLSFFACFCVKSRHSCADSPDSASKDSSLLHFNGSGFVLFIYFS